MPSRAHQAALHASLFAGALLATACVPGVGPRDDAGSDPALDASSTDLDAGDVDGGSSAIGFTGEIVLDDARVRGLDPSTLPAVSTPCRPPMLGRVDWASDGDTINVQNLGTGAIERVRIIGVDTPEVAHEGAPAECFGEEARAFTSALVGHDVWLTFERSCLDTYDRTLAHVYVAPAPAGSWARQLLRRGLASVLVVSPNRAFESVLQGDESTARAESVGLWSGCP